MQRGGESGNRRTSMIEGGLNFETCCFKAAIEVVCELERLDLGLILYAFESCWILELVINLLCFIGMIYLPGTMKSTLCAEINDS